MVVAVFVGVHASMMPTGLSMCIIPMPVTISMRVLMPMVFLFMRVVMSVVCMSMMAMCVISTILVMTMMMIMALRCFLAMTFSMYLLFGMSQLGISTVVMFVAMMMVAVTVRVVIIMMVQMSASRMIPVKMRMFCNDMTRGQHSDCPSLNCELTMEYEDTSNVGTQAHATDNDHQQRLRDLYVPDRINQHRFPRTIPSILLTFQMDETLDRMDDD
jgi:hypothetical protein